MYREGHIGLGLILYSPMAYHFIQHDWLGAFAFGAIAISIWSFIPDVDMVLPIRHRGPTHSFVAAFGAGLLTAFGFAYFSMLGMLGLGMPFVLGNLVGWVLGFVIGFVGVTGHMLGDVLTPAGIRPWWPYSNRRYSMNAVLASDKQANKQLSFGGALALTVAIVLAELGLSWLL